ncbi:MAG: hypothetical protein ACE1Y4_18090 [Lysobacterales bacterium]
MSRPHPGHPTNPNYGSGLYRRRIRLTQGNQQALGDEVRDFSDTPEQFLTFK